MGTRVEDLRRAGLALVETHLSWVYLGRDQVWKVKKPLVSDLVDYGSPEKRLAACHAELVLNRRLARDVYREVVPVEGAPGAGVDWAVRMTRLEDAVRADRRLYRDALGVGDVDAMATRIARFHAGCRRDQETRSHGRVAALEALVRTELARGREVLAAFLRPEEVREVETWQLAFLDRHAKRFEERVEAGRVCEGHGDLRLEHVFVTEEPTIIDCLEFDARYRCADVCADVAMLAMDLAWHGRVDLAERFVATYSQEADDYDLYPLCDFFESARAWLRARLAGALAADPAAERRSRERAVREARRFALLALAAARRGLVPPVVIALGGLVASGKSTVADHVAARQSAPVVVADRTREFVLQLGEAGDEPESQAWVRHFAQELPEVVYGEVLRRAEAVLAAGRPVVLDGCFRSRALRDAARDLATRHGVPFYFVECRVDPEEGRNRLRERARAMEVEPQAWIELYEALRAEWEPPDEIPEAAHVILDTARPLATNLAEIERRIPPWPARGPGWGR